MTPINNGTKGVILKGPHYCPPPPYREEIIMVLGQFMTAGVVPCGGPKKSPRTSSIVQIIFFFVLVLEISKDILRNQKLIIRLDSVSKQCLMYLVPFG